MSKYKQLEYINMTLYDFGKSVVKPVGDWVLQLLGKMCWKIRRRGWLVSWGGWPNNVMAKIRCGRWYCRNSVNCAKQRVIFTLFW